MPKAHESSTETLFHHWRRGDAGAGKAMAQRFTDWYYAIAVSRLGETSGNAPFRAACARFSQGVVQVTDPRRLLGWAHGIAREEVIDKTGGGRLLDGDDPNAFTRNQRPKALLAQARTAMPKEVGLLERAFAGESTDDPYGVLKARYAVKTWLRDHADVPFRVTPTRADPDRTPIPFYEAGHLRNSQEEVHFELWMLNELEVCQDVAEFAHYAIALRGGLPAASETPQPTTNVPPPVVAAAPTSPVTVVPALARPAPAPAVQQQQPAAGRAQNLLVVGLSAALLVALGLLGWMSLTSE